MLWTSRLLLLSAVLATPSWAFPWMVKHGYGSCASCHVDPSGAGQLTSYGRAQADLLVRWRTQPPKEDEEVPPSANFLWFLELPEAVNLSGNLRYGSLIRAAPSFIFTPLPMAADFYGTINLGPAVAHVTTGLGIKNAGLAAIAPICDPNPGSCGVQWVGREFWLGAKLGEELVMVRAGRMNLPFGLRNNEHPSYVRLVTRTDINTAQQYGVSVALNTDLVRGEVMGILGNFQIGPDARRERGYSAFAEYALAERAYLGASSLITFANEDFRTGVQTTRHAHGLFARLAPVEKLALLAEADLLAWQEAPASRLGFAAFLQGDYSLMSGLHAMATLEAVHAGRPGEQKPTLGGWLSASWYFLPHLEVRMDHIFKLYAGVDLQPYSFECSLLLQLHAFL